MTTLLKALKSGSALAGTLALLIGCSPTSPKLEEQKKIQPEAVKNVGGEKVTFNPRVDILFVVDDSGSMADHQQNLAQNVTLFIDGLKNNQILDYQIGVITTSTNGFQRRKGVDGILVGTPAYVDRKTPGGLRLLQQNLEVGTMGSAQEKFFDPIHLALTAPALNNENAGFYRPQAHLAVIFITDTEDQSRNMDADSLYQFLIGLKGGDKDKVATYGVFIPTGYPDTSCRRDDRLIGRLERFVAVSNAKTFGICDLDYGKKLAGLADDLVNRVFKVMPLSRPALPETIQVKYGTQIIPNDKDKGWVFDPARNALVFGEAIEWTEQPDGTELEVDFMAAPFKD